MRQVDPAVTWPASDTEVARRLRTTNWSTAPLGPIEQWPPSLRTTVDLVLAMPGPANLLWGPAHIQLYNDAYIAIAEDRHPALLGRPAAEGWPEIYATVLIPVLEAAFAGRATRIADSSVDLQGADGSREERAFNTTWSPIWDESGAVGGALEILVEVTDRQRAQSALREGEARHRLLIERWTEAVWETNAEGVVVVDSPSWRAFTGQTLQQWLGDGWLDAVHPDDRVHAERQWREAIASRGLVDAEFRLRNAEGKWRWINVRAAPVLAADGSVEKWVGMNIDIDARRHAQAALQKSEERFRSFADASQDVLWIVDAATRQLEYVSPAYERIWGEPREAILADLGQWAARVHPDDLPPPGEGLEALLAGRHYTADYRVQRRDGTTRHIHDTGFPIFNKDGRVCRLAGVAQDWTDRRLAERALIESERRTRTLMEGIPQLVWRSGDAGRWTWSSHQWREFTGQSQEEGHGLGWLEAVHPDDRDTAMRAWAHVEETGGLDVEFRVRRAVDGAHVWHHTRALPVLDERGEVVEWLGTTTDVQQLKLLQQRQSVLVAELQHRTRNLIAVIRSIAEQTMRRTGPTEAFRASFAHRLEALSRVQALLSRAEDEPVTIESLIRMELDALDGLEPADGQAARVLLQGPPVPLRHSIVQTLALALHELATNARKYGALASASGRLRVNWEVKELADAERRLHLTWQETGVHMPGVAPRARRSYGRELIERALPYALGATTDFRLTADGILCAIVLPLVAAKESVFTNSNVICSLDHQRPRTAPHEKRTSDVPADVRAGGWLAHQRHDARNALSNVHLQLRLLRVVAEDRRTQAIEAAQRSVDALLALFNSPADADGAPPTDGGARGPHGDATVDGRQEARAAMRAALPVQSAPTDLTGRRIMIVEDDYFLASELANELASCGVVVLGPVSTVATALELIDREARIDGALLDLNLQAERSYPVADLLLQRKVPFVFTTGYDASAIPARYAGVTRLEKPVDLPRAANALFAIPSGFHAD